MTPLKLAFAGTPQLAATILAVLVAAKLVPCLVLTQPDRRAGRGRKTAANPVKQLAVAHSIPVWQPATLAPAKAGHQDAEQTYLALQAARTDVLVVAAYGLLLPARVLHLPRLGCLNVHASLLPRWRGASPIQAAILAGDTVSGVSIMQMEEGLDTGPVWLTKECSIVTDETTATLTEKLAVLGAQALLEVLEDLAQRARPEPQDDSAATYAPKIGKDQARLDFSKAAGTLEREVRAYTPWPTSYTAINGERVRILEAAVATQYSPGVGGADLFPGTVITASAAGIVVATGEGALAMQSLQRAGGKPVNAAQYLNARPLRPGIVIG
ncbi:MAG: methionyl-tRNA formyltransferase [Gammaproteobacteria bacterium]|nr:methionyl-tRNA formyltransferase [Gammaproteobacteria bacterium]